ncbi:protein kinase domain-containing protein [Frigidibacter mobilis]|uniref:Non-specific serine/threonine protein kinase n=1 Tax=Frigidibacter mobilis TaxID=1335048 RepID=A0A159Z5Y6_9RHOB|nr:protein kinase [Frigidibacter mobilis]AMY70696.1 non-specific serine/threonine protein kinase [Frigidibacter mobilis]
MIYMRNITITTAKSATYLENVGINYSPEVTQAGKKVHSTVICSILDEIESFRSLDKPVILPEREVCAGKYFGDCSELLGEIASDSIGVRKKLDARFEHLGRQHGFDGKQVAGFIREYGIPIELCSVMGPAKPYNVLETGTISSNISSTNASNVWLMLQADGSSMCAVKSMSSQAFKDPIERESFRRGVESVYQLNTSNESVAPRYIFHTNVPMAFGMELINGASLRDFSESSADSVRKDWKEIFLKICRAIHHCHRSNGQVLHRDIKPKNIIFEGLIKAAIRMNFWARASALSTSTCHGTSLAPGIQNRSPPTRSDIMPRAKTLRKLRISQISEDRCLYAWHAAATHAF